MGTQKHITTRNRPDINETTTSENVDENKQSF